MFKTRYESVCSVLVLIIIALCAPAQSGRVRGKPVESPSPEDKEAVRLRVEEVLLPVSVRSSTGKLLPHLGSADFTVTEDGKRQHVNDVLRTPANVLFILDAGGESVLKNTNVNREIALNMIDKLGSEDRAAIIAYGDKVNLLTSWTSDKDALRRALKWNFRPTTSSHLYNSLIYAAEDVLPNVSGRRSVVLLTDGVDPAGTAVFENALALMHVARATVYVVNQATILLKKIKPDAYNVMSWYEMIDPQKRKRIEAMRVYYRQLEAGAVTLKGLAEETGGAIWDPETLDAMKTLGESVLSEISTEYVIAYSSERPRDDKAFHPIKVFGARPDLLIRSRRGIYPGPTPKASKQPG